MIYHYLIIILDIYILPTKNVNFPYTSKFNNNLFAIFYNINRNI